MTAPLTLVESKGEARVDSRVLAEGLQNKHKNVSELIDKYAAQFSSLGQLLFQTEVGLRKQGGGKAERFALLNEDQAYLLLAMSRNTAHIVEMKTSLVKAFKQARAGQHVASLEYLPGYHELHDLAHDLADGSKNERFVHSNLNKLINKTVGIGPGQRQSAASSTKSAIVVAQRLAIQAMEAANDHHDGYQSAKTALSKLQTLLLGRTA
jgi:phage regulator Rha-like protein